MLTNPFLSGTLFIIVGVIFLTLNLKILTHLELFGSEVKIPQRIIFWKKIVGFILIIIGILALLRDIFL